MPFGAATSTSARMSVAPRDLSSETAEIMEPPVASIGSRTIAVRALERAGEPVDVGLGHQGDVVAGDADDADLGVRNRVEHAVEHAEAGAQDGHRASPSCR